MTKELPNPLVAAADTLPPLPPAILIQMSPDPESTPLAAYEEADMRTYALQAADKREAEVRTEAMRWREAIINELVIAHIYSKEHDDNPRKAIQDAISWNCAVALDPAVSSDAQALVEKGRAGMEKDAMRPLYVAVDIGCLECGESSDVLGIFTSEQDALNVLDEAEQKQAADWHGEHSFQVFKIAAIVSASAVEGKTSTEVRALTPLLETKE